MSEKSFPFFSGQGETVTEPDWEAMAGTWQDNGVYGHPGDNSLKIEPSTLSMKITLNAGEANINGFHYSLTSDIDIDCVPNGGVSARNDLVLLKLDRVAKEITPILQTGDLGIPDDHVPIGIWIQPIAGDITPTFWGSAQDARWFMGARVRPAVSATWPPASTGGILFEPGAADSAGAALYRGMLVAGNPEWVAWTPMAGMPVVTKTANYTVDEGTDCVILADTSSNSITITLPSAVGLNGKLYSVKKANTDLNTCTVTSATNIDGFSSWVLSERLSFITVVSDGSQWRTISERINRRGSYATDTNTSRSVTSTSYATFTSAQSVTIQVPPSGIVEVEWGGMIASPTAAVGNSISVSIAGSGANTISGDDNRMIFKRCMVSGQSDNSLLERSHRFEGLTPGSTTFSIVAKVSTSTGNIWQNHIRAVPVP
jgi:hypothetical protein